MNEKELINNLRNKGYIIIEPVDIEAKTQIDAVLEHMQKRGSITSWEAILLYGATRLSGIIFELKKKYNIIAELIEVKNRFGGKSQVAKYTFIPEGRNKTATQLIAENGQTQLFKVESNYF